MIEPLDYDENDQDERYICYILNNRIKISEKNLSEETVNNVDLDKTYGGSETDMFCIMQNQRAIMTALLHVQKKLYKHTNLRSF